MGINESFPLIRGKTVKFDSKKEEEYFERSRKIIKLNSINNAFSDYNLIKSLEEKKFIGGRKIPKKEEIRDMSWIEYLNIHLKNLYNKYKVFWITRLLYFINSKNLGIYENKYFSDIFYYEYQLITMPKSLISENDKISKRLNSDNNFEEIEGDTEPQDVSPKVKYNNDLLEIDVTENLGGSFWKITQADLPLQYEENRKKVKYFIKKIKEDLYYNDDHPFHLLIKFFNEEFGKYIKEKIKDLDYKLEKEVFNKERYELELKNFEEEITYCLQEIICKINSALKLFYSTSINLMFLEDEKDDLFNLVISSFFRIGNLYRNIVELYNKTSQINFLIFQERLIKLKNIEPKQLGLETRFCLNDDTLKLQNELKEKKKINKEENKEEEDKKEDEIDILQILSEDGITGTPIKIEKILAEKDEIDKKKSGSNPKIFGDLINHNENLSKNNNIQESDENKINFRYSFTNFPIRGKKRNSLMSNEEIDLLENISNIESSKYNYSDKYEPKASIRSTIDNFNNKKYFFPNLNKTLTNNSDSGIYLNNEITSKTPYFSAIKLLKSIIKYKTPFEKIILLAAISDQIMESANTFWKGMEQYIAKDFLYIDSDEFLKIFLFVVIKTQMPEILIECKIINNFTSDFTKSFNLSYNFSLLQASIDYINDIKDINSLNIKEDLLMNASKEILNRTTDRLSRVSSSILDE